VLCYTGSCVLSLRSWGKDDSNGWIGYMAGNGVVFINFTRTITGNDIRGFNTAIINSDSCTATDLLKFDTFGSTADSDDLAIYLLSLPSGTIIAGVTIDSAENSLTHNARSALSAIGVGESYIQSISYRSKLIFVATIGQPTFTISWKSPEYAPNLQITVGVPCTYTHILMHILISMIVCLKSINHYYSTKFHLKQGQYMATHDINNGA